MKVQFYEQQTLTLVGERQVQNFTFDVVARQFLLPAGYVRTPVQASELPVEFMVSRSSVRLFFKSTADAKSFMRQFELAMSVAEERNNSMLD